MRGRLQRRTATEGLGLASVRGVSPTAASRLLGPLLLVVGCGFGQLQTARTIPAGQTQATIGHTFVSSGFRNGRESPNFDGGTTLPFVYVPPHLEVRRGLSDNVDIGGRLTFGFGFVGDVKVNLLPAHLPLAIAVAAGGGVSVGLSDDGIYILQLPVTLSASYDIAGRFTPYVGLGYRGIWMWGNDDPTRDGYNYTAPTGRGEGLLTPIAGIAIGRTGGIAVLLEYGRLVTMWNDPGHGYTFVPAHLISIGFRTGRGRPFER
jgi:hypothetical protein